MGQIVGRFKGQPISYEMRDFLTGRNSSIPAGSKFLSKMSLFLEKEARDKLKAGKGEAAIQTAEDDWRTIYTFVCRRCGVTCEAQPRREVPPGQQGLILQFSSQMGIFRRMREQLQEGNSLSQEPAVRGRLPRVAAVAALAAMMVVVSTRDGCCHDALEAPSGEVSVASEGDQG